MKSLKTKKIIPADSRFHGGQRWSGTKDITAGLGPQSGRKAAYTKPVIVILTAHVIGQAWHLYRGAV